MKSNTDKWVMIFVALITVFGSLIVQYTKRAIVINNLLLPVRVFVDSKDQGILQPSTQDYFFFENLPGQLEFELVRNINSDGEAMGDMIEGEYKRLSIGRRITITTLDSYFYPIITNNLDKDCDAFANDGLKSEKRIGIIRAGYSDYSTGYFPLFTNSNVTLYCDNEAYFWGIRDGAGSSFMEYVSENGTITIILEQELVFTAATEPAIDACNDSKTTQLSIGLVTYISFDPPDPNRVRSLPGKNSPVIGELLRGEESIIIDGPICKDGWRWWKVNALNKNLTGWTPEGNLNGYWLIPK